jgi:hypothetical protein
MGTSGLQKEFQMLKRMCLLAVAAGVLMPTAASPEYYIVQEKSSRKCKVVETRPTETTWIQVGPMAFKTRDEADRQVRVVCKERR